MKELNQIKNLVDAKKNVFVTGAAGTGKSYIIDKLRQHYPDMTVTATTGIAAVNVGGVTVHSFAGVGIGDIPVDDLIARMSYTRRAEIGACSILCIDEVSMLSAQLFDLIDQVFRRVRDVDVSFGGVVVVLVGDFLQLPPVNGGFCFEADAWSDMRAEVVVLDTIYRQSDLLFCEILNQIRLGSLDQGKYNVLTQNTTSDQDILHLFARNATADAFNAERLSAVSGRPHYFKGEDSGEERYTKILKKNCLAPKDLFLKVGARVMLLKNLSFDQGLINGSTGTVVDIVYDSGLPRVRVLFDCGTVREIEKTVMCPISVKGKQVAHRFQYPLRLAWALSIHKSQGMTLDRVKIDMYGLFESGQAYVALSRARSLDGLYVDNFNINDIVAHPKALRFLNRKSGDKNHE